MDRYDCEKEIEANIEYDRLCRQFACEDVDEIVALIVDTLYTTRPTVRIGGDYISTDVVRERFPVIIRNLDRDEAIISMVDSNLKREKISPMEKARAYQMKTDAMRRKVGRRSNAEILNGEAKPLNADQELAKQVGESVATIQRFKTLNKLTPELQEMVDQGKIPVNTGADIAQMKPAEQNILADAIKREDKVPTGAKAKELKEASKAGTLTEDKINQTVAPTKRELEPELKVTFSNEELRSYFPDKSTTVGEVKRVVFESLTMRQKALERRAREAAEKGKAPPPAKTSPSKTR